MNEEPILRRDVKPMVALIIFNWDYVGSQFDELLYPEQDGEVLEKTLETAGYASVKVVQNISDMRAVSGGSRQSISSRRWKGSIFITQVTLCRVYSII